jgi:hypothetical protein
MIAMYLYRVFLGICLTLIFLTPASALNLQKGMHGMPWSSAVSQHAHLTKVRESGQVVYYVNSKMIYQVVNQSVTGVFYGFYRDQFFSVHIKLRTRDQFDHLKQLFSENYGKPKVEKSATGENVVYRWKDGDVKIKIKMKESIGDIKLAVYYTPISAVLNEEYMDRIRPDTYDLSASGDDQRVNLVPLLKD